MVEFRETSGKAAAPASTGQCLVAFGDVRFDIRSGEVWHAERAVQLTPRAASVLALLIERAPQLVTKQEMVDRVWDGRIIGDEALTSCVQELRRALADDACQPRYIETRHRRGYRLISSVAALAADSSPTQPDKPSIAVLAFQNMSGDPEQEYFADGMVEDIIRTLSICITVRHCTQFELYLQRPVARHQAGRQGTRRSLCARRQRAQSRRPGANHRPARRLRDRRPSVGR